MSLRIIKPIPGCRGVEVQWIRGLTKADAERIAKDLARDIQRTVDMYDRADRFYKNIQGVK